MTKNIWLLSQSPMINIPKKMKNLKGNWVPLKRAKPRILISRQSKLMTLTKRWTKLNNKRKSLWERPPFSNLHKCWLSTKINCWRGLISQKWRKPRARTLLVRWVLPLCGHSQLLRQMSRRKTNGLREELWPSSWRATGELSNLITKNTLTLSDHQSIHTYLRQITE